MVKEGRKGREERKEKKEGKKGRKEGRIEGRKGRMVKGERTMTFKKGRCLVSNGEGRKEE